jgi:trehalose 6-phosphate synthase
MRFLIRLLGALWLATLLVSGGFAWYEVHQERSRQAEDLQRRASLAADAVREASERLVARGVRNGYERVLTRFGRQDRVIAIYDAFGSVIEASPEVKGKLGPISPLVSEAIQKNQSTREFATVNGRTRLVHVVPLQQEDRAIGAAAVLIDAEYLEATEWDLWQRTAVRFGVLMLLLTGITWVVVRWSVTRPMTRIAEWTRQLKSGQPVAPPPPWRRPRKPVCDWSATACGRKSASSSSSRSASASVRSTWCPTGSRSATSRRAGPSSR